MQTKEAKRRSALERRINDLKLYKSLIKADPKKEKILNLKACENDIANLKRKLNLD